MCPCWLVHAPQLAPLSIVMVTCSPCCSRSSMASVTNIYSVAFAVRTIRTVFIGLFRNPIKVFQYELNEVNQVWIGECRSRRVVGGGEVAGFVIRIGL